MLFWKYLLWISLGLIFYNYIGYAVIVYIINLIKRTIVPPSDYPGSPITVSFIVAAYNEENCIEEKILNSIHLDYPPELIEFIFVTDGSTDNTTEIISRHPQIRLIHNEQRHGKTAAVNRAVDAATNDILIFSDANTILNKDAISKITRHYSDIKVGGVAGEKKVITTSKSSDSVGAGEGMYWKYESALKKLDSEFYSVVGAAGELFSVRKALYEPVSQKVILDDFIISMRIAQKGFRIIYEPGAVATELPSFSFKDEEKRKIRIAAGGFQAIGLLGELLLFWKQPRLSFLYISHRVLRWAITPFCLILTFLSNFILLLLSDQVWIKILFLLQLAFYLLAMIASVLPLNKRLQPLKFPYYFVFMNLSVIKGFFKLIRGKQTSIWDKSVRKTAQVEG